MENKEKQPLSVGMKLCRVIGVVLVCAAIGYLIWSGDFDHKGIVGYVDDFMLFMAAYTFARGSFLRPERRYIRRQLYMLSSLFALLALCWVIMLAFIKSRRTGKSYRRRHAHARARHRRPVEAFKHMIHNNMQGCDAAQPV